MEKLIELNLSSNQITDLVGLGDFPRLVTLKLASNKVEITKNTAVPKLPLL